MDPMTGLDDAATAQAALRLEIAEGIGWLVFDRPASRVNLLTSAVLRRLDSLIGELEAAVVGVAKVVEEEIAGGCGIGHGFSVRARGVRRNADVSRGSKHGAL